MRWRLIIHAWLAHAQLAQALLRNHHAPHRPGRYRAETFDCSRPAAADSDVSDDCRQVRSSLPSRIATRSLPTRHLAVVVQHFVLVLRYLEKVIHPRWHTPIGATKRLVGAVVLTLSATLVLIYDPTEQRRPGTGDCPHFACLSRGGWNSASYRCVGRRPLVVAVGSIWEMVGGAKGVVGLQRRTLSIVPPPNCSCLVAIKPV
jgi:hypothetical protein